MIAHMVCAFKEDYMIGARRVRRILLDMADALCEAKCVNLGISAEVHKLPGSQ
jgi:hypothetical protein